MRHLPHGSHGRFQRAAARLVLAVFLLGLPGSPPARADYSGDQLVAGDGYIEQQGSIITIHAADGSIFEFDTLNVWADEELQARMTQDGGRLLLDVLGGQTSYFLGDVSSNGFLYILNPAGIFFGGDAVIDTQGLVAAAGTMNHADFLAGVDRFELAGAVQNEGRIEAPHVALLGTVVANRGDIVAPDGTIALVAGERALLTRLGGHLHVEVDGRAGGTDVAAIDQSGRVDAGRGEVSFTTGDVWSLAVNHEGITRGRDIDVRAASGTAIVSGRLDASDTAAGGTGGHISVTGERVALLGAELDASGDAGGGEILVGGDYQGQGDTPTARRTFVSDDTELRADAGRTGDGGRVIVWADEKTAFYGALSARGGAESGDGGFAEISGKRALVAHGDVDLGADAGETGTLLYDPTDILIRGGTSDGSGDPDTLDDQVGQVLFGDVADGGEPFEIFESEIEGTGVNANVRLQATNSITSEARDQFTNQIAGEGVGVLRIQNGNNLTLQTQDGDIDVSSIDIDTTGADAVIDMDGNGADGGAGGNVLIDSVSGDVRVGEITAAGGAGIGTVLDPAAQDGMRAARGGRGGNVTLTTGDGAIDAGSIDTSGATSPTGGNAGDITVEAGDADSSGTSDVTLTGDLVARGGMGTAGTGGAGGSVSVTSEGALVELVPGEISTSVAQGGGAIDLMNVDTRGGDGTSGGAGGGITVRTTEGAIQVADLVSSGGAGSDGGGGSAGAIDVSSRDNDGLSDNPIVTGTLTARGGDATNGVGGDGGEVSVETLASREIVDPAMPDQLLQESRGGGDVTVGAIDTRGGTGSGTLPDDGPLGPLPAPGGDGGDVNLTAAGVGDDTIGNITLQGVLDAREGGSEPGADTRFVDGGFVDLDADGDLERTFAGPHIRTSGSVNLAGDNVGATGRFELEGGGEDDDFLTVFSGGRAEVHVLNTGFLGRIAVVATDAGSDVDIDVTQAAGAAGPAGDDVFDVTGTGTSVVVNRIDTRGSGTGAGVQLLLDNEDPNDGAVILATGSVTAGGEFIARSDGDIVVGDADGTVITMQALPDPDGDPDAPTVAGRIILSADFDNDGSGAVLDAAGANTGVIDTRGDADEAGSILLAANGGVGRVGDPITLEGGGTLSAGVSPVMPNGDPDASPPVVPDPDATNGIFVTNRASGDLAIFRAFVSAGTGDIDVSNTAGDLVLQGGISARPTDPANGSGGDVRLTTAPGSEIVSDAGLVFLEAGDTSTIVLDTDAVDSAGSQVYAGDLATLRDTELRAGAAVRFEGDVTADAGLAVLASGPIGFAGGSAQTVFAHGDLVLQTGGAAPHDRATIGKTDGSLGMGSATDGDLVLMSDSGVRLGDGEKLTVAGALAITAPEVRVTDLSALSIDVTSADLQVFAREPGQVLAGDGRLVVDTGTDILANTVRFSSAPTVVGSGPGPRIATQSGAASGSGPLGVTRLPAPLTAGDLARPDGSLVFDLAIPFPDPGNETPELEGGPVEVPLPLRLTEDAAVPPAEPTASEVVAYLSCGDVPGCAVRPGSALDTPRGEEIAARYRALLGDAPEARAGRRALAEAAADPSAPLAGAGTAEPGRRYLTEVALLLAQVRLLGLDDATQAEVRRDVLEAVRGAIGASAPSLERLEDAVRASGPSLRI